MICPYCEREIIDDAAFCPHCNTPVEGATECDEFTYEAFVSYRHLPHDREVALALQKSIEGFSIPKHLRTEGGPTRLGKMFRDEDELPTSSSLSDQIRDALEHSRYLFVVCSPQTNESLWVARELELFASYHGRDKIRIVLAEAEPDDSFPTLLRTRLARNAAGELVEVAEEPLAADFRDLSRKHVNTEKLRLIAPLLGCGFDDLRQRMRARRTRIAVTAAAVVTAVSIAFGSFSTYQQFQIQENYRKMQINESEALATEANELLANGNRMQAIQVALAALPGSAKAQDRPYVPAAQLALENALGVYPPASYWSSCYSLPNELGYQPVVSENGYVALYGIDRTIEIRDLKTGKPVCSIDVEKELGVKPKSGNPISTASFDGDKFLCVRDHKLACFDAQSGELNWVVEDENFSTSKAYAVSPDGKTLVFVTQPSGFGSAYDGSQFILSVVNARTGELVKQIVLPPEGSARDYIYSSSTAMCFQDNGTVVLGGGAALYAVNLENEQVRTAALMFGCATHVYNLNGQLYVLSLKNPLIEDQDVALEVFDSQLQKLWDYVANPYASDSIPFSVHGLMYPHNVSVCGLYEAPIYERPQVIVVYDNLLMLLDSRDGTQSYSLKRATPFAACAVVPAGDSPRIIACTCAGDLLWRNPGVSDIAGAIFDTAVPDCYSAAFVTSDDGSAYLVQCNESTSAQRVYRYAAPASHESTTAVANMASNSSFHWNSGNLSRMAEVTADAVILYDLTTLDQVFSVPLASLESIDDKYVAASVAKDGHVYMHGKAAKDAFGDAGFAVSVLSPSDGSVELSFGVGDSYFTYLPSGSTVEEATDGEGHAAISVWGNNDIWFFDHATGELLQTIKREAMINDVFQADKRLVICESAMLGDGSFSTEPEKLRLVDKTTGEEIDCDLSGCVTSKASGQRVVAMSGDCTKLVVACEDGFVRMFDVNTGKQLWEADQGTSVVLYLAVSPVDGNVLLQDGSGICMLLSGKDGSTVRASSTSLPSITADYGMVDGESFVVRWRESGMASDYGLAYISLDPDMFGPQCVVNGGFIPLDGGKSVLANTMLDHKVVVLHRYGLDELLAQAHDVVAGHELTEAERRLYRIAGE